MQPQVPTPNYYHYPKGLLITLIATYASLWFVILPVATATDNSAVSTVAGHIGSSLLFGSLVAVCVVDWHGATTIRGLINWQQAGTGGRIIIICLIALLFYVFLGIYLARVAWDYWKVSRQVAPSSASRRPLVGFVMLGVVSAFALLLYTVGGVNATTDTTTQQAGTGTTVTLAQPTNPPAPTATPVPPPPTMTSAQATATFCSYWTNPPPGCPGAAPSGSNPWGYNFTCCNLIYSPPDAFCSYFACINNFWNGTGYVEECQDSMYSKSGGRSGSCSFHGGNWRPLLAPSQAPPPAATATPTTPLPTPTATPAATATPTPTATPGLP